MNEIAQESCEVCGSDEPCLLFGNPSAPAGTIEGIVRCRRCGLVYRQPLPPLETTAAEYRDKTLDQPSPDWVQGRKDVFKDRVSFLSKYRQLNRICDVGTGPGFFLGACADDGWQCQGIEISTQAARFAEKHFGINISLCTLSEARFGKGAFDAVTFWNVLDQLHHPGETLLETRRILRENGLFLARFPNAAFHVRARSVYRLFSRLFNLKGRDPSVFHLYSFDRHTITRLLQEKGFTGVCVRNAALSWTTGYDKPVGPARKTASRVLGAVTGIIAAVTFNKLLIAPSLIVTAQKGKE